MARRHTRTTFPDTAFEKVLKQPLTWSLILTPGDMWAIESRCTECDRDNQQLCAPCWGEVYKWRLDQAAYGIDIELRWFPLPTDEQPTPGVIYR